MANILLINPSWRQTYKNILSSYNIVGYSPLSPQVIQLLKDIKKISQNIFIIGKKLHCSALQEKSIIIEKIIKMIIKMKGG